jgi:hypothetical protein
MCVVTCISCVVVNLKPNNNNNNNNIIIIIIIINLPVWTSSGRVVHACTPPTCDDFTFFQQNGSDRFSASSVHVV